MSYARSLIALAAVVLGNVSVIAAGIDPMVDCLSDDNNRRLSGCSAVIDNPQAPDEQRSFAYGMRALAYSLLGVFDKAIADYDEALKIRPEFPLALNNRAWAYYKLGRPNDGMADVESALALSPGSPYALDTRAHINQALGNISAAFHDYDLAMRTGGEPIVKMYQCGLRAQGLYFGELDGEYSQSVKQAMQACAGTSHCDPLPPDSDCRPEVS